MKAGWPPLYKAALPLALWLSSAVQVSTAAQIELGGYYKNIFASSKTLPLLPPAEPYLLDLNRLRLQLRGSLNERISFDLQYDNEIMLGDYLETAQFSLLKRRQPDTYFDLSRIYVDNDTLYGGHSLYRAYVDFSLPEVSLRVGRQRIAWGTAMLWNPMDILNPFNPIQLERLERQGIDAALADWDYDALSRVSLVYARQQGGPSSAVRWRSNLKGFDLSLMAGRFRGDAIGGFDFAGQLGEIGVRGEITRTRSGRDGRFTQAVVGADYTFSNTLSLNLELYYNGQGASDTPDYQFDRLLWGEIQSVGRRYLGGYLGYDITPLLRWDNFIIVNLGDDSFFLAPSLVYSLTDNLEGTAGVQAFSGDSGTEYGTFENLYHLQLQWFF